MGIRTEARKLGRAIEEEELGAELLTERKLLQGTSEEVLRYAKEIAEANKKAEEAYQQACEERSRAESGFSDLQEIMSRHKSLDEPKEMELALNSLLGSAETRIQELEKTKSMQDDFYRSLEEKGEIDAVDKGVKSAVKFVGLLSSIFGKSSTSGPRE